MTDLAFTKVGPATAQRQRGGSWQIRFPVRDPSTGRNLSAWYDLPEATRMKAAQAAAEGLNGPVRVAVEGSLCMLPGLFEPILAVDRLTTSNGW